VKLALRAIEAVFDEHDINAITGFRSAQPVCAAGRQVGAGRMVAAHRRGNQPLEFKVAQ
jgi:hypothetical protein